MSSGKRVLVLGAGLAGLRSAQFLLEKGHDVELLEKLDDVGGMARSHEVDGFVFDHGPHGFFSSEDWLMEEFKETVGGQENYLWLTKWSQIHYRGELFNHPLKIRDLASKMSPWKLLHTLISYLWSRLRLKFSRREPANTEEYLIDQFGQVLYDEFFGPYTNKVWAVDPTELDADFARDRVPSLHLWEVIRKLFTDPFKEQMRKQKEAKVTPSGRIATHDLHTFYYPRQGARALPNGYRDRVLELGGRLRLGVTLEKIDLEAGEVHGRVGEERFTLPYDAILSTIPLDVLASLLRPSVPDEIEKLVAGIRYRGILLVNLCVAKPQVIGPFWIYYTDRFFNRISEYRHFSPDLAPADKTGICLEIGCNESDWLWNEDDSEIVRLCLPDLVNLGLLRADEIEAHYVIREANAYPIYDIGYKDRVNRLVSWLESEARVMTAGRQGRFLYINQDAAIISGRDGARAVDRLLATGEVEERAVWATERPRRKIVS